MTTSRDTERRRRAEHDEAVELRAQRKQKELRYCKDLPSRAIPAGATSYTIKSGRQRCLA
jgi:hypothetical protein